MIGSLPFQKRRSVCGRRESSVRAATARSGEESVPSGPVPLGGCITIRERWLAWDEGHSFS